MKFVTVSGSMYEVDLQEKKCRRLIGTSDPTPRQGKDGDWKVFQAIHPDVPVQGKPVLFVWDASNHPPVDADPDLAYVPTTMTSLVKEIVSSQ